MMSNTSGAGSLNWQPQSSFELLFFLFKQSSWISYPESAEHTVRTRILSCAISATSAIYPGFPELDILIATHSLAERVGVLSFIRALVPVELLPVY